MDHKPDKKRLVKVLGFISGNEEHGQIMIHYIIDAPEHFFIFILK